MSQLYQQVLQALQKEDKEKAVQLSIDALTNKAISVEDLYENVLSPALAHIIEEYPKDEDLIWREHVRSGIIRTIIENAYPFVVEAKRNAEPLDKKVIVICPEFEDHELGAKMVTDFFKIAGYDATFIGARTPLKTLIKAIEVVEPTYIAISVTNFYNFTSAQRLIAQIKEKAQEDLIFILGGRAVSANPESATAMGADLQVHSFADIKQLSEASK